MSVFETMISNCSRFYYDKLTTHSCEEINHFQHWTKKTTQKCEKKQSLPFLFLFQICEVGGFEIIFKETLPNLSKN
jgi:hypothetical protein